MPDKLYRIITSLSPIQFSSNGLTAEVELFREGTWKHPSAPGGWFEVDHNRIQTFINNFNRGICGAEIPLEFGHVPDSKTTPGWITKMYEKNEDGILSLWATLNLTDSETAEKIKDGSLRYISPTVMSNYVDSSSGQEFEVIRSATLTNYPHIKNLNPVAVNFEEVIMDKKEKNDLFLEDLESATLDDLSKSEKIDLEDLSENQIKTLADHFDMTVAQFQDKFPNAGKEYGKAPRIKVPAGIPPEQRKEFMVTYKAMFEKYKDEEKALKATLRRLGIKMEEPEEKVGVKEFTDRFVEGLAKALGIKKEPDVEPTSKIDQSKFEEMQAEIEEGKRFRRGIQFQEDKRTLENYKNLTPAAGKILQTLLTGGREVAIQFEDQKILVHDLIIDLFSELKSSPKGDMFITLSEHKDEDIRNEDIKLNELALQHQKDNPKLSFSEALLAVSPKKTGE